MRAVIDLGTNTFNLLIAEVTENTFKIVETQREAVLLGMGGINHGFITDEAIQRALAAIGHFKQRCEEYGVSDVRCIGTSALREARNTNDLIQMVQSSFGYTIEVISGQREAELIYNGTKIVHSFDQTAVIMDIGGGSTEFIKADSEGAQEIISLDIGVSRIYQSLNEPKDFNHELERKIYSFLDDQEAGKLQPFHCPVLIGSSGSFETFYEMLLEQEFDHCGEVFEMTKAELLPILEWTIHSTYQNRLSNKWITAMRKEMLPIAAIKVKWTIEKIGAEKILISPYSLKEGALMV